MAERAGTSTDYIAQIEQKKRFPSPEMIEKLALGLNFDSPDLFSTHIFTEEAIKTALAKLQTVLDETKQLVKLNQ